MPPHPILTRLLNEIVAILLWSFAQFWCLPVVLVTVGFMIVGKRIKDLRGASKQMDAKQFGEKMDFRDSDYDIVRKAARAIGGFQGRPGK